MALVPLLAIGACRKTPTGSGEEQTEAATMKRRSEITDKICAAHLRQRGINRADPPRGAGKFGGAEADRWTRPSTIQCGICETPVRDGDKIIARIAIVNTDTKPADIYLQAANRGPYWLETVPPTPPPPAPPTPIPETYPSPALLTIPPGSAVDTETWADIAPDVLKRGGSVLVRGSVVFWRSGAGVACGELNVQL